MARIVENSSSYSLNVRTDADSLGQLLGEAKADTKRILLDVLIRLAISGLAIWIWSRQGDTTGMISLICYAGLLVFTVYPLIHSGDTMRFYENGIMFKKKTYLFRSRQVKWLRREGVMNILEGRYLYLEGHKQLNASYVHKPLDVFAKAYGNVGLNEPEEVK